MPIDRIRILHLIEGLKMGGAEILITQLIKALGKDKYKHFVYYFAKDGPVRAKLEELGIPVYKGPERASIKQPVRFMATTSNLIHDLVSFIRTRRIQVIQSHLGPANQLSVLVGKLLNIPAFPTIHTPMTFVDGKVHEDSIGHFKRAIDYVVYRNAAKVLVVSQEIKEIMRERFYLADDDIFVLKNGITLENDFSKPCSIENEFPGSKDQLKIIAVGRLVPLKNFHLLIRVARELMDRNVANFLVLIVGEGDSRPMLEALIEELDVGKHVKLLGLRNDIIQLMTASDFFVMSSSYEGVSLAMIEAMACGMPIICSDIRSFRDCIKHGENGLLYPVGDHIALAEQVLRLSEDAGLRTRLSRESRKSFEEQYDMRENIKPLDHLFQQFAKV